MLFPEACFAEHIGQRLFCAHRLRDRGNEKPEQMLGDVENRRFKISSRLSPVFVSLSPDLRRDAGRSAPKSFPDRKQCFLKARVQYGRFRSSKGWMVTNQKVMQSPYASTRSMFAFIFIEPIEKCLHPLRHRARKTALEMRCDACLRPRSRASMGAFRHCATAMRFTRSSRLGIARHAIRTAAHR